MFQKTHLCFCLTSDPYTQESFSLLASLTLSKVGKRQTSLGATLRWGEETRLWAGIRCLKAIPSSCSVSLLPSVHLLHLYLFFFKSQSEDNLFFSKSERIIQTHWVTERYAKITCLLPLHCFCTS